MDNTMNNLEYKKNEDLDDKKNSIYQRIYDDNIKKILYDEDCTIYRYNMLDFILPSKEIFMDLCQSYDRTYLFLTTIIRFIITYYILINYKKYVVDKLPPNDKIRLVEIVLMILCYVNLILLFIILFKKTYEKDKIEEIKSIFDRQ